jgi:uroporphyrinogen-III synthase
MHVLITRPERDAADLKSRIEALGCTVTLAPLLSIELGTVAADAFVGASGIIATSRNGLRALAQSPALHAARSLPIFVVGTATAKQARELGFETIIEGEGTAAVLQPLIAKHRCALAGKLVHLAGDHLAFDLAGALKAAGVDVKGVVTYRSVAAKTLNEPVPRLLAAAAIDAVVLMSPRSAHIWGDLILAMPFKVDLSNLSHICLSAAVAEGLQSLSASRGAVRTEIAALPTMVEIVALVYRLAGHAKTG